ncbi:MAG: tRNA preQ1(34) S-adenosylmethionine ribosyltransferase-isomerase QueA [Dehalococcoidia bacterium]
MKTSDFDYVLPDELVAQVPTEPRDHSRLLVLDRSSGELEHRRFYEVGDYLRSGDVLVLNESRVIPARLLGRKAGGGARIEFLLLNRSEGGEWEALARPGRRVRAGTFVEVEGGLGVEVISKAENGTVTVRLSNEGLIDTLGEVPLPPYIHSTLKDVERYQTVYARNRGSVAAPTAGLHFTPALLESLTSSGVEVARITLHVGLGSFRPVKSEDPAEHRIHREYFEVSGETARKFNSARENGNRIVAVGTTAVRALEQVARPDGEVIPYSGFNELYILPGYPFRTVDAMITNFHLPRSTLLMLVAAFAGRERVLEAYQEAIREGYRFYSFGDAMLIV